MPQKRNPDVFELVRGAHAPPRRRASSRCSASRAKLPSGYQRDLQLHQGAAVPLLDICHESLDIMAAAIAQVRFQPERIRLDPDIHAAAEANALVVKEGIPFREAYRRVGRKLRED